MPSCRIAKLAFAVLATVVVSAIASGHAQTVSKAKPSVPALARSEIPVHRAVGDDGIYRYWITLTVDGQAMPAFLDTGSVGLLVLDSAPDAAKSKPEGKAFEYSYGSGVILGGHQARALVGFAAKDRPTAITMGQVTSAHCQGRAFGCKADAAPFADFRILGKTGPQGGFRAIIGAGLGAGQLPNPFAALGAKRWLVDLPQGDLGDTGRLILNPDADDLAGFVVFDVAAQVLGQHGAMRNAIAGCLVLRKSGERVCGPMALDTGAPQIQLSTPDLAQFERVRAAGDYAFEFGADTAVQRFEASALPGAFGRAAPRPGLDAPIFMPSCGLTPFWNFSVLYDASKNAIGLKRRPQPAALRPSQP